MTPKKKTAPKAAEPEEFLTCLLYTSDAADEN